MQRYWPSAAVGLAVTAAITIAFSNLLVGALIGASAAIVMVWEQRSSGS